MATSDGGKLIHHFGSDVGAFGVKRIARLACLEEHVRVLRRAAQHRVVGVHRPLPVRDYEFLVDHLTDDVLPHQFNLRHFMRRAETVEEVQEWNAAFQCGGLRNQREIHRLLHTGRTQQRKTGSAGVHYVAVIAEDGQRVGGQGAGGDVEHSGRQLPCDLEHVGHLQQQSLRRRKRAG